MLVQLPHQPLALQRTKRFLLGKFAHLPSDEFSDVSEIAESGTGEPPLGRFLCIDLFRNRIGNLALVHVNGACKLATLSEANKAHSQRLSLI